MNNLMTRLVDLDWQENFTPRTLERGFDYASEGRVQVVEVGTQRLLARCKGSGGNVYSLVISLTATDDPHWTDIDCVCSCPVEVDCKHAAAVLFEVITLAQGLDDSQSAASDRLSPQIEQWLNNIPAATPEIESLPKGSNTCLLYQLNPDTYSNRWSLAVYRARLLKKGGYGEIKALYSLEETLARAPGYMLELDKRICRLLLVGRAYGRYGSSFPLEGEDGAEILQLALKTERLFVDFDAQLPLNPGPTRLARFNWAVQAEGSYRPQWLSDELQLHEVLPLKPLHYLNLDNFELGPLEYEMDDRLAIHLSSLPEIPASQVALFSHRISAMGVAIAPPRTLTERILDTLEPQPCLTLGSDESYSYHAEFRRQMPTLEHRAALAFRYEIGRAHV